MRHNRLMKPTTTPIRFAPWNGLLWVGGQACAQCAVLAMAIVLLRQAPARAVDVSAPATLQMFEARWNTITDRQVDLFYTGYGAMWLPPPSRADSGDQSVGYDVYDRFDLGRARKETLYGTDTSLKTLVNSAHNASVKIYTDLILNHNGFSDLGTVDTQGTPSTADDVTFAESGGYPGFAITLPTDVDGDFHGAFEGGDLNGRLAGLVDIAQEKTHQFIRHPVAVGNPNNIPAGTTAAFGRLANVPDPNNARFYQDQGLGGVQLDVDPGPGQFLITRHDFNLNNPLAGDATIETAEQLLMRNAQWMVQVVGVDGFRLDAEKHFPTSTLTMLDQAVFRASNQTNHDGSIKPIYSFGEVLDGNKGFLQTFINQGLPNPAAIDPADFTVQGNRDVLDFPLFFGLRSNLTGATASNNWHGIRNASQDLQDDGFHNGSQGVSFVDSHDNLAGGFPFLKNVAYAYTLMMPGQALVYLNAEEFGTGRSFPNDGKDDALGGFHGEAVPTLVNIRNTHGRGDFRERWIDDAFNPSGFSNIYVYERSNTAVVALSSRNDSAIETRNGVQTDFAPNTILVELTGNAADPLVDPSGLIPETVKVDASGQIDVSIPGNGTHRRGYVIYGLANPQGTMSVTNVAMTLAGATPTAATNGTARLGDIEVIRTDTFDVSLNTTPISLTDPDTMLPVRDFDADGDTALLRIDEGMDLNNVAGIDNATPGSVAYAFEDFTDTRVPGYIDNGAGVNIGTGTGTYTQTIDATQLSEGRHYITTRAFRHRDLSTGGDGGPAVYSEFKQAVYIDRLPPEAAFVSFDPFASSPTVLDDRDLIVQSTDQTADNMHIFLDLPEGLTDSQVIALALGGAQDAGQYDSDSWVFGFTGVTTGNHVATVVTFEPSFDGTNGINVQRFPGLFTSTGVGAGFGDLDADNIFEIADLSGLANNSFEDVLFSQNVDFNAAADLDGDGDVDNLDLFALGPQLVTSGANQTILDEYGSLLLRRGDVNQDGMTNGDDIAALHAAFGGTGWLEDLNVDGVVDLNDVQTLITDIFRTENGDFDLDGDVDGADMLVWQLGLGTGGALFHQGDANLDGNVNATDLAVWQSVYGSQGLTLAAQAEATTVVPEPHSLALGLFGVLLGMRGYGLRMRRTTSKGNLCLGPI